MSAHDCKGTVELDTVNHSLGRLVFGLTYMLGRWAGRLLPDVLASLYFHGCQNLVVADPVLHAYRLAEC